MKLPTFVAFKGKPKTSGDVAALIARNTELMTEARTELARLDAARPDVLLSDDRARMQAHDAKAADLRLSIDMLSARDGSLGVELRALERQEASAALDARRAEVQARADAAADWLRETYPEVAHELVAGLTALQAAEREITKINAELTEACRDPEQHLFGIQERLKIVAGGGGMEQGMPLASGSALSLGPATRLLELVGGVRAPGWEGAPWS